MGAKKKPPLKSDIKSRPTTYIRTSGSVIHVTSKYSLKRKGQPATSKPETSHQSEQKKPFR